MEFIVGAKYLTTIMPGDEPVVTISKVTPKRVYYTGELEGYVTKEVFASDFRPVTEEKDDGDAINEAESLRIEQSTNVTIGIDIANSTDYSALEQRVIAHMNGGNHKSNIVGKALIDKIQRGEPVIFYSLETTPQQMKDRIKAMMNIVEGTVTGRVSATKAHKANTPKGYALSGPWDNEPDHLRLIHNGIHCLILRHPDLGSLCGYVRVPRGKFLTDLRKYLRSQPLGPKRRTAKRYLTKVLRGMSVHGGVTFASKMTHHLGEQHIWVGFDCSHYLDLSPNIPLQLIGAYSVRGLTYRNIEYVAANCKSLADQIKARS